MSLGISIHCVEPDTRKLVTAACTWKVSKGESAARTPTTPRPASRQPHEGARHPHIHTPPLASPRTERRWQNRTRGCGRLPGALTQKAFLELAFLLTIFSQRPTCIAVRWVNRSPADGFTEAVGSLSPKPSQRLPKRRNWKRDAIASTLLS